MELSPEVLVPRIGEVLISDGLITEGQLELALKEQKRVSATGRWTQIGEVLVKLGYINREALNQAITRQIINYQEALIESNRTLEARVAARTEELEIAYRKLSELDILKTNFVSNISHELRTPLTHIKGYLDLVLCEECIKENPDVLANLEIVQRATERLENLINDLITFSSTENGQLILTIESFNVVDTVESSISRYSRSAASKNISVKLESSPNAVFIDADKNKITWIFNQLIDNSIKYIEKTGEINIRISAKNEHAIIEISDNGPGINQSQIDDVFLPFHQLDGKSNRAHGGTGIGLTLVKRIIEAHGSEIFIESNPTHGTRFRFQLPLSA